MESPDRAAYVGNTTLPVESEETTKRPRARDLETWLSCSLRIIAGGGDDLVESVSSWPMAFWYT